MTFAQLLERIDEVEVMVQECSKECREKYYNLLDELNTELENRIRHGNYT
jgi:hypothetical protein